MPPDETHTPLPWIYDGKLILHDKDIDTSLVVCEMRYDENYYPIRNGTFQWRKTMANAAFIVTACNAHYDLLKACKEASEWCSVLIEDTAEPDLETIIAIRDSLNTAVAKAEGR